MMRLVLYVIAAMSACGQVALPSEEQRWAESKRLWETVTKHRPDALPADTKPEVAAKEITASEDARIKFLRNQRGLLCGQAEKFRFSSDQWLSVAAGIEKPEVSELIADLDARIAAVAQELEALTRGDRTAEALANAAWLRRQLEELRRLRVHLVETGDGKHENDERKEKAVEAVLALAKIFKHLAATFQAMVEDSVGEERKWRRHHNLLRKRFGLPEAALPPAPEKGGTACAQALSH